MGLDNGNGCSKYSRTYIKETDGNESNKQSRKHQELDRNRGRNNENWIVGNGSNKHSNKHLEHDDEAGSSEYSSEVSGSFKSYLELDAETGSSNQSDTHSEVINGDAGIESNHFELNPEVIKFLGCNHNKTQRDTDSSKQSSSSDLYTEGQNGDASLTLKSEVSSVTDEPRMLQSPPVQVMDRVGVLDTYKIPSAVFARSKLTTQVDNWSLPSTDSLFSIPLENGSFAIDHNLTSNSGELFKSGEFAELSPIPNPVVPVEDTEEKGGESDKREETSVSDDAVQDKTGPSIDEPIGKKPSRPMISWSSATKIAHHSVDRVATAHSIASPVRNNEKKCAWPSCNCSSCWLAVCHIWNRTILPVETCFYSKEKAQKQQQKELPMASRSEKTQKQQQKELPMASRSEKTQKQHWCCGCNWFPRNLCSRTL